MEYDKKEFLTFTEAGKMLGVSGMVIKASIINGTMPVGFVGRKEESGRDCGRVIRKRLEKWLEGNDLEVN